MKEWDYLTSKWTLDLFEDVKSEEISKEIAKYNKVVLKSGRNLGADNEVVLLLRAMIDKFAKTVPIVTDLKSPALENRHWEEITTLLKYSIKENAVYLVYFVCYDNFRIQHWVSL